MDDGQRASRDSPDTWFVYTGASFDVWNPDTGTYFASVSARDITGHLQHKRQRQHRTSSSPFAEFAAAHIADPQTLPCLYPRIAFRDITNATNTRTIVVTLIPGNIVVTNKAPYLLWPRGSTPDQAFVLGVLSSMVLDWVARRVVELSLNFHIFNSLPIADPGSGHPVRDRVVEIAGRLAAVDERFAEWAAEVGVPVGSANDEATKTDLIHELDACVAHLYGLDEDDLEVIYTTFDEKRPDRYLGRHAAVLDCFRRLP